MAHGHRHADGHTRDRLMHRPRLYDLNLLLLGRRARRLWDAFADDLRLMPGDRVLDVGCGPGRLALAFAERVTPGGRAQGVDAAEEMVRRATDLAGKRGLPASFQAAFAQRLPFHDASFDAVSCTLALHHVAVGDRRAAVEEMYRVLKPSGRVLLADFQPGQGHRGSFWLRRHHGEDMIKPALELAADAGFTDLSTGRTVIGWLGKLTGVKAAGAPR